ncbi:hypothetical protein CCO03_00530 [Comamonas serinivorans]|uniref:Lipoprotein n=1 Tax=Comamonas serinivorans TaxID=1082851 RepID=A0A1Y0ES97_9BURK|nr:hypothetical protein [Comamonas serinivorans]ARU06544.1 hypothetical protein CCO03_00530 [Comamonas serinivorans]
MHRLGLALAPLLLVACGSAPTPHGEVQSEAFSTRELIQSDSNRMASLAMRDNLNSLFLLMDKLYRRNPAEWKKTADSPEAAVEFVRIALREGLGWGPLGERRDVAALDLALKPEFQGDRVAAFIYATADSIITAHGGSTSFNLVQGVDAQHVYNAARNMEIAMWVLASRRKADGTPLLLSNEMSAAGRNLSFEREMGKVIGRLDLLASFTTEKYRRAVISYAQGVVAGPFLQFLPVK